MNALLPLVLYVWSVCRSGVSDSAADLDSGDVELALGVHCHGGIGIIWSLIWFKVYQPPRLTKGISKAELDYIRDGGGLVDGDAPVKKRRVSR